MFFLLFLIVRLVFFFFNDTATTEIYTLSLHDALPISSSVALGVRSSLGIYLAKKGYFYVSSRPGAGRSEEHTSELQSHSDLVCRLLLEKKKKTKKRNKTSKNNRQHAHQDPHSHEHCT